LYAGNRYKQMKRQAPFMEPRWKEQLYKQTVTPLPRVLNPTWGQVLLVTVIGIVTIAIVLTLR
jgi:hypothetical protein